MLHPDFLFFTIAAVKIYVKRVNTIASIPSFVDILKRLEENKRKRPSATVYKQRMSEGHSQKTKEASMQKYRNKNIWYKYVITR